MTALMSWLGGAVWEPDRATQAVLQASSLQESASLHSLAGALNWWGGPGVIWFAALLWLGARALGKTQFAKTGLRGAEGIALSSAISGITKGLAGRARPFLVPGEPWHFEFAHGWTDARYFSMPSGHTTATFGFAVAASMAATTWAPLPRRSFTALAMGSAFLVAFARTYSNQHWLSDVVAGALLGSVTAFAIVRLHRRLGATAFDRTLLGAKAVR